MTFEITQEMLDTARKAIIGKYSIRFFNRNGKLEIGEFRSSFYRNTAVFSNKGIFDFNGAEFHPKVVSVYMLYDYIQNMINATLCVKEES